MTRTFTAKQVALAIAGALVIAVGIALLWNPAKNKVLGWGAPYGAQQVQQAYYQLLCSEQPAGTVQATSTALMVNCPDGTNRGVVTVLLAR